MDASRSIPFDSPRRADPNETLRDSAGHLPPEGSPFYILLTYIDMRRLRNLYYSIPLDSRIPTHTVPIRSDHWLNGYAYLCAFILWVSTFKLLTTECHRHADTSRLIAFDSPRRADINEALPDSGGHLPAEVSAFFTLLTSIAMRTLRELYNWIPHRERASMKPSQTLADICPLSYLPFSSC